MSDWEVAPDSGGSDWAVVNDEEGGPESFLHPDKFKPSPGRRAFKNQTGPIEQVRSELDPRQLWVPKDVGEAVAAPVLSAADRLSFGALAAGMRGATRLNEATGTTGPTVASRSLDAMEGYRSGHPVLSRYTDLPAYLGKPTQAVAEGVERLLPQAASLPARALRATVASGGTGAVIGGAEAAANGEGLREGGLDALHSGEAGLIGGAAVAAPLSVASAAAKVALGSRGAQARRFLERQGVDVGVTSPGRGPKIDSMVTRGSTDADIGHQAEVSAKRGLDMLNEEKKGVLGVLGRRIGGIEQSGEAAHLQDVTDVVRNMHAATEELDTSPQARAALTDLLDSVRAKQGQGFNPDTDNYMLSEADVNKLRRQLDRYAKTGQSTDASLSPIKQAAHETRSMVNEGPFADANADYAKESKHYQQSRRLLGINERPKGPEETHAAVNKVKNLITRRGQNTVTAGGQEAKLAEFELRHPDIGEELLRPEILRKRADIGFHLFPQHGGLIDRTEQPIASIAAHALLGGATGVLPMLAYTNRNALAARLLYNPSLLTQAAETAALGQIPGTAASSARTEERR